MTPAMERRIAPRRTHKHPSRIMHIRDQYCKRAFPSVCDSRVKAGLHNTAKLHQTDTENGWILQLLCSRRNDGAVHGANQWPASALQRHDVTVERGRGFPLYVSGRRQQAPDESQLHSGN